MQTKDPAFSNPIGRVGIEENKGPKEMNQGVIEDRSHFILLCYAQGGMQVIAFGMFSYPNSILLFLVFIEIALLKRLQYGA